VIRSIRYETAANRQFGSIPFVRFRRHTSSDSAFSQQFLGRRRTRGALTWPADYSLRTASHREILLRTKSSSANTDPPRDRKNTADYADRDENADGPQKLGRLSNPENTPPEMNGSPTNESESKSPHSEHDRQETRPGILKSTCHRNGSAERKGRRRQTRNEQCDCGVPLQPPAQICEELRLYEPSKSLFAQPPANYVEKEHANHGTDGRRNHTNDESIVVPSHKQDCQQIIPNRNE